MQGLICEHYRLTEKLGEGGIAEVWAAEHVQIGHKVAIKLLLPHLSARSELASRFLKEAKAVAAIRHPGIIQIFGYGNSEDGRAFISMEYLPGEALAECLQREGQLSLERSKRLIRQLASALNAAHDKQIWHRDLKPENLFLVPDPEVEGGERLKVLDFGLAKVTVEYAEASETVPGSIFGTPAYMAPEQCLDAGAVDGRADLYSIGCIFYRCLTGRRPFNVTDQLALIQAQIAQTPEPPRRFRPEIPFHIDSLIMRLLAKERTERVPTCAALLAELDDSGVPVDLTDQDSAQVKTLIFNSDIERATRASFTVPASRSDGLALPGLARPGVDAPRVPDAAPAGQPGEPPRKPDGRAEVVARLSPYPHPWPPAHHANSSISGRAGQFGGWGQQPPTSASRQRGVWVVAALVALGIAIFPILDCLPTSSEHGDAAVFDGNAPTPDRANSARPQGWSAGEMSPSHQRRIEALLRQAETANREGRYRDAYAACEQVLMVAPSNREAHSECAYAACRLNDVARVQRHLGGQTDAFGWHLDVCQD